MCIRDRRTAFLGSRIPFRSATVVDAVDGSQLGAIDALEMVTLGQRRGIGLPGGGPKRYVVDIDHASATVMVGEEALLLCDSLVVHQWSWAHQPVAGEVRVQSSAHGATAPATASCVGDTVQLRWQQPQRRVSPGQSVVLIGRTADAAWVNIWLPGGQEGWIRAGALQLEIDISVLPIVEP